MAAIQVENYQNIADYYSEAQLATVGLTDYYWLAATEIVNLSVFDPELDLLAPFYNAYLAAVAAYSNPPVTVLSAVGALQSHIIDKARTDAGARFSNIDQWLDAGDTNGFLTTDGDGSDAVGRDNESGTGDNSFRVPSNFAVWSGQAGFPIDSSNVTS